MMTVREARALGIAVATLREEDTRHGVDPIQSTERIPGRDALRKLDDFANLLQTLVDAAERKDVWSVEYVGNQIKTAYMEAMQR